MKAVFWCEDQRILKFRGIQATEFSVKENQIYYAVFLYNYLKIDILVLFLKYFIMVSWIYAYTYWSFWWKQFLIQFMILPNISKNNWPWNALDDHDKHFQLNFVNQTKLGNFFSTWNLGSAISDSLFSSNKLHQHN